MSALAPYMFLKCFDIKSFKQTWTFYSFEDSYSQLYKNFGKLGNKIKISKDRTLTFTNIFNKNLGQDNLKTQNVMKLI